MSPPSPSLKFHLSNVSTLILRLAPSPSLNYTYAPSRTHLPACWMDIPFSPSTFLPPSSHLVRGLILPLVPSTHALSIIYLNTFIKRVTHTPSRAQSEVSSSSIWLFNIILTNFEIRKSCFGVLGGKFWRSMTTIMLHWRNDGVNGPKSV